MAIYITRKSSTVQRSAFLMVTLASAICSSAQAALTCAQGNALECVTQAIQKLQRAEDELKSPQEQIIEINGQLKELKNDLANQRDRFNALLKSLQSPRQESTECIPGSCNVSCHPDEIMVGTLCYVPGTGQYNTGYVQNIGVGSPNNFNCVMGDVPQQKPLGRIAVVAWCAKLP